MRINKEFETLHLDKDELYVWHSYREDSPYDHDWLSYGDMSQYKSFYDEDKELWYMPNLMSGSDYGGDTVTRSNYLAMKQYAKRSKFVKEVSGGHGTYALAFNVSRLKGKFALELVDIFKGLQDYPCVDDEAMSNLEMELENEYWENDLKEEFCKAIERSLSSIGFTIEVDRDSEWLFEAYRILMDKTNTYPVFETGCSIYIDVEELCHIDNLSYLVEPVKYHDDFKLDYILVADYTDLKEALRDPNKVEYLKEREVSFTEVCQTYGVENSDELTHILDLYYQIKKEWVDLSFEDRERLAEIGKHEGNRDRYLYLYYVLKEMEK